MDKQITLRPSDVAVALALGQGKPAGYQALAHRLHLGLAQVHRSVQRLERAGLVLPGERRVNRQALLEFIEHGVRYAFPPQLGPEVRGVPTAGAAPGLAGKLPRGPAIVWPSAEGRVRGQSLAPLYDGVPGAALADASLHRLLALVDVLRIGQIRERRLAQQLLRDELHEEAVS
jgi:hypothetical protein